MGKRVIFGAIFIALMVGLLWLDWHLEQIGQPNLHPSWATEAPAMRLAVQGLPLAALTLLLAVLAYYELRKLAAAVGLPMPGAVGVICTALIALYPFWVQLVRSNRCFMCLFPLLPLVVIALFADQLLRKRTEGITRRLAGGLLAVAYLGICGSMLLAIRLSFGVKAFVLFLGAVKGMDMGAYFCGKSFGRHKLIPWLSPNKTWEGLVGGAVAATLLSMLLVHLLNPVLRLMSNFVMNENGPAELGIPIWQAGLLGLLIGLAGQGADLCESALKRDAKVKDTGALVPEFGGVLDIIDSPLLAAPIAYSLFSIARSINEAQAVHGIRWPY